MDAPPKEGSPKETPHQEHFNSPTDLESQTHARYTKTCYDKFPKICRNSKTSKSKTYKYNIYNRKLIGQHSTK